MKLFAGRSWPKRTLAKHVNGRDGNLSGTGERVRAAQDEQTKRLLLLEQPEQGANQIPIVLFNCLHPPFHVMTSECVIREAGMNIQQVVAAQLPLHGLPIGFVEWPVSPLLCRELNGIQPGANSGFSPSLCRSSFTG